MGLIVFRADASLQVGHGHIMRCLSLADALREQGHQSVLICSANGNALQQLVVDRGHIALCLPQQVQSDEHDASLTLSAIQQCGGTGALLVMDNYQLSLNWERVIRKQGIPLMVIDDMPRPHDCNLLLDQNIIEDNNPYSRWLSVSCRCLLGPRYALLRPEFSALRPYAAERTALKRILLFFGGSDADNETGKALLGLQKAGVQQQLDIVIGGNNPHRVSLLAIVQKNSETMRLHVQTREMADLIAKADLAIGAGGSASWERCCLKLPSIISVLSPDQTAIAERLAHIGACINLGDAGPLKPADYAAAVTSIDDSMLAKLSCTSGTLVDGLGATRVAQVISEIVRNN